jgi:hypothetical protein
VNEASYWIAEIVVPFGANGSAGAAPPVSWNIVKALFVAKARVPVEPTVSGMALA